LQNIRQILKHGREFLIDRGDLSKATEVENIPVIQRKIFSISKKIKGKKIFVATDLLGSLLHNKYPTKGEANDVFNTLEMGASGLVLAGETAVGKYPQEAVIFLRKIINAFKKNKS